MCHKWIIDGQRIHKHDNIDLMNEANTTSVFTGLCCWWALPQTLRGRDVVKFCQTDDMNEEKLRRMRARRVDYGIEQSDAYEVGTCERCSGVRTGEGRHRGCVSERGRGSEPR